MEIGKSMTYSTDLAWIPIFLGAFVGMAKGEIVVHSNPIRPSVDVDVYIESVWNDSCVPEHPAGVSYTEDEIELVMGLRLVYTGCDFAFTPYELTVSRLNVRRDAPVNNGPIMVTQGGESVAAELQLPPASTEFVYFTNAAGQVLIYRADNWALVDTLSDLFGERLISDQAGMLSYAGQQSDDDHGVMERVGFFTSDFNHLMAMDDGPLADVVAMPGHNSLYIHEFYLAVANEARVFLPPNVSVDLPALPSGLGLAMDRLYVSLPERNSVLAIDRVSNEIIDEYPVGALPTLVHQNTALDRIVVFNSGDGTVSVITSADGSVVATLNTGSDVLQFVYSEPTDRFYAIRRDGRLAGFSGVDGAAVSPVELGQPAVGMTLNSASGELYIALEAASGTDIRVLDESSLQFGRSVHLPIKATSMAHYASESYWQPSPQGLAPVAVAIGQGVWRYLTALLVLVVGLSAAVRPATPR